MDSDELKAFRDNNEKLEGVMLKAQHATASDTTVYPVTRGVLIRTAGTATFTIDDADVTFASGQLAAGVVHPLGVTRFKAGSTAVVTLFW